MFLTESPFVDTESGRVFCQPKEVQQYEGEIWDSYGVSIQVNVTSHFGRKVPNFQNFLFHYSSG